MKYNLIKYKELIEFKKIIYKYGYKNKDFNITEEESHVKTSPANVVPLGCIIIQSLQTQQKKCYPVTAGVCWTNEFENDLLAGYFNLPLT